MDNWPPWLTESVICVCLLLWLAFTVKQLGWEGLWLLVALGWDELVAMGTIMHRRIPYTHIAFELPKLHSEQEKWAVLGIAVIWAAYTWALLSIKPKQWLLGSVMKWPIYLVAIVSIGLRIAGVRAWA